MVAMAGMYVGGVKTFASFGDGTMTVVAVAMLARSPFFPRCSRGSVIGSTGAALRRRRTEGPEGSVSGWVVDRVLRRPGSRR